MLRPRRGARPATCCLQFFLTSRDGLCDGQAWLSVPLLDVRKGRGGERKARIAVRVRGEGTQEAGMEVFRGGCQPLSPPQRERGLPGRQVCDPEAGWADPGPME